MSKDKIFIALGGNIGNVLDTFDKAISSLRSYMKVLKVSSYYRTKPAGFIDQDNFYNGAILVCCPYSPLELLNILQKTEKKFGKEFICKNGPRSLDLDIVFWGDRIISLPQITIPHPRALVRDFVLVPCAEMVPQYVSPSETKTLEELVTEIEKQNCYILEKINRP